MTVQEAVRRSVARGARGSDPRPLPAIPPVPGSAPRGRSSRPGPARTIRRAFAASFAVHGLVLACFAGDLFGPTPPAPRPTLVATGLVYTPSLEPDLPPLDLAPPEVATATPLPVTLVEVPPETPGEATEPLAGDAAEPPGPLPEIIGITSPRGFRRGVVGARGGGGSGGRSDSDLRENVGVAACPAPPSPREPVLAAPRLRVDRLPTYPATLRAKGAEGEVRVRVRVGAEGAVAGVEVAVSSGSEALDEAALEAARAWLFDPATEDGRPVAATVFRWVRFHLVDAR